MDRSRRDRWPYADRVPEGTQPVFTTLISPGRGGFARPGEDPIEHALTPTGTFPISGKFATATMEAPGELIHSDVPDAGISAALTPYTLPTGTTVGE